MRKHTYIYIYIYIHMCIYIHTHICQWINVCGQNLSKPSKSSTNPTQPKSTPTQPKPKPKPNPPQASHSQGKTWQNQTSLLLGRAALLAGCSRLLKVPEPGFWAAVGRRVLRGWCHGTKRLGGCWRWLFVLFLGGIPLENPPTKQLLRILDS